MNGQGCRQRTRPNQVRYDGTFDSKTSYQKSMRLDLNAVRLSCLTNIAAANLLQNGGGRVKQPSNLCSTNTISSKLVPNIPSFQHVIPIPKDCYTSVCAANFRTCSYPGRPGLGNPSISCFPWNKKKSNCKPLQKILRKEQVNHPRQTERAAKLKVQVIR